MRTAAHRSTPPAVPAPAPPLRNGATGGAELCTFGGCCAWLVGDADEAARIGHTIRRGVLVGKHELADGGRGHAAPAGGPGPPGGQLRGHGPATGRVGGCSGSSCCCSSHTSKEWRRDTKLTGDGNGGRCGGRGRRRHAAGAAPCRRPRPDDDGRLEQRAAQRAVHAGGGCGDAGARQPRLAIARDARGTKPGRLAQRV